MANSDALKRLFRSSLQGDRATFIAVAREVIADARKKRHTLLARDLEEIIRQAEESPSAKASPQFTSLPKGKERGLSFIDVCRPRRQLDDLILCPGQRETLDRVCEEFRYREILEAHALTPSSRLLFCGPPGCGKTATAEAIAGSLGLSLLVIRFDAIVSSLLGETSANLRQVFEFATHGSWVILFDEFDAIGRSREDPSEHGEMRRVVSALLQMLDRFEGHSLVIAATNFERSLDAAVWRRFDEVIRFERPNAEQADRLFRRRCGHRLASGADLSFVLGGLGNASHAEIERTAQDALKRMTLAGREFLDRTDFEQAVCQHQRRRQDLAGGRDDHSPDTDRI